MKLQDINPAIWAEKTYYENDGTSGVNPWRNGSTPTKLEPPPGTSQEGWVPNEPAKAEHENFLRNQTTQLEAVLSFDRLGDARTQWYPSTAADLDTLPIYDSKRRKNIVCAVNGTHKLWELTADMRLVTATRPLIAGTPGTDYEGAFAAYDDTYLIVFPGTNSFERYSAATFSGAPLTITAGYSFQPCRPLALPTKTLFSGKDGSNKACVISVVSAVATIITLPSPPTSSQARFVRVPNGNIYYFVRGDSAYYKSTDSGATWSRNVAARPCYNAVYDPNADVWTNFEATLGVVPSTAVYLSSGEPGAGAYLRALDGVAICAVETFGRYVVALAQRKTVPYLGAGSEKAYVQVLGSRDAGKSWAVLDTIRASSTSALSELAANGIADVDYSSGAYTSLFLGVNENGWAVRYKQASYHLQFMRPLAQQDTTI